MKVVIKEKRILKRITRYLFTKKVTIFKWQLNMLSVISILIGTVIGGVGIIPRIFALNETQYIIAQGGNTDFSTGTPVNVSSSSTNISLAKNTGWYSLNWNYKKQLTLKNTSSATLNTNSAMSITIDTSTLESVLANCNDLRIVYQGTTELPLTISREPGSTNCNDSKATVLTFPIQANLTTGASDSTNYFLYYGNSSATSQGTNGYSIPGGPVASMVCSFKSSTTCETGQTPTTESGAIRYSGSKSGLNFDEQNDYLSFGGNYTPSNSTYELWYYPKKFGSSLGTWQRLLNSPTTVLATSGSGTSGNLVLRLNSCSGDVSGGSLTAGNWYHIAFSYDGSIYKVFLNGQLVTSKSCSTNTTYDTNTKIGFFGGDPVVGVIDEVRVSDNVRYTNTFTPSTTPFVTDANTKLLYHFDENGDDPRNTGKTIDASGNGNHGTISGAKYVSGLVGVDKDSNDTGKLSNHTYASHSGVFIEEGTTNLVTNPSFEHGTYNTNWSSNYMNYATASATFTPNMSKRNSAGPFAAGPIFQGDYSSTSQSDLINWTRGNTIAGNFYQNLDTNQGSLVLWITPEWNGNEANTSWIYNSGNDGVVLQRLGSTIRFYVNNTTITTSVLSWTAGSTYNIVARWDYKNTIDGTNYVSLSINGLTTYGGTVSPGNFSPGANNGFGHSNNVVFSTNAIIEGFTVYRRVLFDGTYGTNVGNGNEISQIYNSGTGKDPTEITGSWDVVFALPTNASTGTLTTGTGNAWSHPHIFNLLYTSTINTGGFMMNGTYGSDGWVNVGSPSSVGALSTSEKIFNGGYKYTSTGANQGIYRTFTATNGEDYVLRALGNSDGICNPQIKITRADGTTEISHLNGTTTSTKGSPDVYIFTWESPASESEQVQLINTTSSGTCYWHQVEVLTNKHDNPSMETGSGDPWVPTSWSNAGMGAGQGSRETSIVHSGSSSFKASSNDSNPRGVLGGLTKIIDKFYSRGVSALIASGADASFTYGHPIQSSLSGNYNWNFNSNSWKNYSRVHRAINIAQTLETYLRVSGVGGAGYYDDIYTFELTDVSLTVTPASQANSTETSGLRVDGRDTLTQPITGLTSTNGVVRFKFTPRHSFVDANKFGVTYPTIVSLLGDNNNYIMVFKNGVNISLWGGFNGTFLQSNVVPPALNAGTTYDFEISYSTGGSVILKINGTQVTSIAGIGTFTTVPTTAWFGTDNGNNVYDSTISNFTTSTITQNTTSPYMKFGSNSVKLVNGGTTGDEYATNINVGNTNAHMLSAYVYDGTTGNIGGIVSNTIAELYYNN